MQENMKLPEASLSLNHYYVSEYHVDNYSEESSLIAGYNNFECTLAIKKSFSKFGVLNFWITVYNLLDEKYYSHAWISSKYRSELPVNLSDDVYLAKDKNESYYYKGLFPQALRHLSLGLSVNFH